MRREIGSRTTSQVSSVACPAPSKGDGEAQLLPLGPIHPTSRTQGLAERVLCVFICKRVAPVMLYLIFKWFVARAGALQQPRGLWPHLGHIQPLLGLWVQPKLPISSVAGQAGAGTARAVGEGRIKPLAGLPPPLLFPPVCGADRPVPALLYRAVPRGTVGARRCHRFRLVPGSFCTAPSCPSDADFLCNK